MSFDLYVFDRDLPDDPVAVGELLEDDHNDGGPLSPALAELLDELERRYPDLDDDPDASPWSSWPLQDEVANGTGVALTIRWSRAEQMSAELRALANERGLFIYDPQAGVVIRPTGPAEHETGANVRRRLWRRR